MHICVLKERRSQETRVAASPETVKKMIAMGHTVSVETMAGSESSFMDQAYADAGATIAKDSVSALNKADIVLKVQRPIGDGSDNDEIANLPQGCCLIGILDSLTETAQIDFYKKKKIKAFAMERVPRITRAQSMDVLSSQSNLAGYRAVIEAAAEIPRAFPMMMTAAGTIAPIRVMILGAGVAGLQAIATARRLGAVVSAFDVRKAAKEQVESLGATFIEVENDEDAETQGGYAKETSKEYQKLQADKIHETLKKTDIAITTALIPGKPAPLLITDAMIKDMKAGSVIVDMATASGGNVSASKADKTVTVHDVKIIGHSNLASRIGSDASALYARNILKFLELITDEKSQLNINTEDEIVKAALIS
ncbi:MAG: Re/Si-specific NAD(P)(+) transhydrogenase subunit alpha [Alphaproteobacteria bacterium]|nr:Re/Si-specific NAD(P)(+) transhydrogenase subunit alpha [Alphaproteobacteria bacterium]